MSPPENDDGRCSPQAAPARNHSTQQANSDAHAAAAQAKRFSTLRARCALVGVQLIATTDDRGRPLYCGTKWAMTKHLNSLDDLAEWVARVDGKAE